MTDLVLHFLLFTVAAIVALAVPLIIGRLIRPDRPNAEKNAIYECGEPTIGPSTVQFDLRFYVVALLFIVFDVEVAFFFPWASVFGTTMQLADERVPAAVMVEGAAAESSLLAPRRTLSEALLSVPPGTLPAAELVSAADAQRLAWMSLVDVLIFFAVLLVGFAYVWYRGDLDWVRAVSERVKSASTQPPRPPAETAPPRTPVRSV